MSSRTRILGGSVVVGLGVLAVLASVGVAPRGGLRFVAYNTDEFSKVKNVHDYLGSPACQGCHLGEAPVIQGDGLTVCTRCHSFEAHRSHVVGVAQLTPPASAVKLPMGEGGVIVCHTCHDPHVDMRTAQGLRGPEDPNRLCMQCHVQH